MTRSPPSVERQTFAGQDAEDDNSSVHRTAEDFPIGPHTVSVGDEEPLDGIPDDDGVAEEGHGVEDVHGVVVAVAAAAPERDDYIHSRSPSPNQCCSSLVEDGNVELRKHVLPPLPPVAFRPAVR